jgi:hypothetical protein
MRSKVWGIGVIWLGLALLARNFNLVFFRDFLSQFWPLLIVLFGLTYFMESGKESKAVGLLIVVLGLGLLGDHLGWFAFNMRNFWNIFWALALILFGWLILSGGAAGKPNLVVMGGLERKGSPWELKSGSFFVIMGGVDLDLRDAVIPEGETNLDFTIVMGGVDLRVPEDIEVHCQGSAVLGGLEFFGQSAGGIYGGRTLQQGSVTAGKKVTITCRTLMGGVEIK